MRRDPLVLPASSLGLTLTGPPGLARARPPLATPARSSQRPHPPDSHRSADSPGSRQHHSQHPSTIAGHPSPLITASSPTGLPPVRRPRHHRRPSQRPRRPSRSAIDPLLHSSLSISIHPTPSSTRKKPPPSPARTRPPGRRPVAKVRR